MARPGKVQTVLGLVDPSEVGIALPHEQPLVDLTLLLTEPQYDAAHSLTDLDMRMENLGKIRQYPYSVRKNLRVDDVDLVIKELSLFRQAGGGTLCDVSPSSVRLCRKQLPRVSRETGLHLVAGTAFYVDALQTEEERSMSVREKKDFMVREIVEGVEGSGGVRCGVIGEVGCSWPLTESERRSLEAAAIAQRETGAPLMIHPGPNPSAPFEILDILESSGADTSHTVIAHLDRTIFSDDTTLRLAARRCLLEYDLFGDEISHYALSSASTKHIDFPTDAERIKKVKLLVEAGHAHQVLLSHDIHTKHRLVHYGGHGYAHILENIVPKMADRGISRDTAMEILTTNPKNWLTFK